MHNWLKKFKKGENDAPKSIRGALVAVEKKRSLFRTKNDGICKKQEFV